MSITKKNILEAKLLDEREKDILIKRFFDGKTLKSIAEEYMLTTERIRQIEMKAIYRFEYEIEVEEKFNFIKKDFSCLPFPAGALGTRVQNCIWSVLCRGDGKLFTIETLINIEKAVLMGKFNFGKRSWQCLVETLDKSGIPWKDYPLGKKKG
jgi:hypothetical protein